VQGQNGERWGRVGTVLRIHKNHLIVLVCSILINPIRIQDPQIGALPSNPFLSSHPQTLLILELIDSLIRRFPVRYALRHGTFTTPSAHTDAVDDIALFGFVAQATGFVGTGGTSRAVDYVELAVFPAADAQEETENVRLFVLVEL
jgi:hypothetical protein